MSTKLDRSRAAVYHRAATLSGYVSAPAVVLPHRILFIETKPTVYGGQKALLARCAELDRRSIEYAIIHPFHDSEFVAQARDAGLEGRLVQPIFRRTADYASTRSLFIAHKLINLVRSESFDIVHTDAFDSAYIVAGLKRAGVLRNVRTVFTIRSDRFLRLNAADRYLLKQLDRLCTNSDFSRSQLKRAAGLPAARVTVTYTPIDFERLRPASELRCHLPQRTSLTIGYMGSLEPRKRLDRFLDFGSRLSHSLNQRNVQLRVFGTPKAPGQYASYTADAPENCEFRGYKTPAQAAAEIDVLFCPFDNEPLGRVVSEFLYLGIPVIAVDRGGLREAGCGYAHLVTGANEDALYRSFETTVQRIADAAPLEGQQLQTMVDTLIERFGVSHVVSRELGVYNSA